MSTREEALEAALLKNRQPCGCWCFPENQSRTMHQLECNAATKALAMPKEKAPLNRRLFDLVRYQRMQLFDADLIDEAEYAELCSTSPLRPGAVERLEDYDKVRANFNARLLRVAEAVAEVQAQRAADYVNGVLGTDFLAGFGEHMRNTLDLAAIVEGMK